LWNELVRDSATEFNLLNADAIAQWASQGWATLRSWELTHSRQFGDSETLAQLRTWGSQYEEYLDGRGWTDTERILEEFAELAPAATLSGLARRVELLDIENPTVLERRCLDLLSTAGWTVARRELPRVESRVSVAAGISPADELERALDWLLARLEADPAQRVALIGADSGTFDAQLLRLLHGRNDVAFARGSSPLELPPVSAAFRALEMLGPEGDALQFSGWLRSPFLQSHTPQMLGAAARFELDWREALAAQLPLHQTRKSLLQQLAAEAPGAASRLDKAYRLADDTGNVATPAGWTLAWRGQLEALGWLAFLPPDGRERFLEIIEQAFDAVAALTPVLGAVSASRALAELRGVLGEKLVGSPLPVAGLHVLDRIDDLGPGYGAIWIMGMSRSKWPPRPRPNPLLPRELQRKLAIPWATLEDCRERSRRSIARAARLAPEVVFSYSPADEEDVALPSAAIEAWLDNPVAPLTPSSRRVVAGVPVTLETVPESIRPLARRRLSGGASLLNLQASCPLRAFIDFRLHARPPQSLGRGVSPALRGQILHRAAAALLPAGMSSSILAAMPQSRRIERIGECARRAVFAEFEDAGVWLTTLSRFERERVEHALHALLTGEDERGEFAVMDVERDVSLTVAGYEIRARIDRIDETVEGGVAVIDYKTGRTVSRPCWFDERHADYQLPLYALALGSDVGAIVLCSIGPDGCVYRGYWPEQGTFPGRSEKLPDARSWDAQLARWRAEIENLVTAFAAGDDSIYAGNSDDARGMYAPLTRLADLGASRLEVSDRE